MLRAMDISPETKKKGLELFYPFLLLCLLLVGKSASAGTPVTLYTSLAGNMNFVVTGASFRSQSDAGNSCALNATAAETLSGIPGGATITAAYLYWGGSGSTPDTTVTFNGIMVNGQRNFTETFPYTNDLDYFGSFANVTPIVTATGNGTYTMSNLTVNSGFPHCNVSAVLSGWGLVVVYEEATEPLRVINIFDGLTYYRGSAITLTPSNFQIPAANINGKHAIITWEGDAGNSGSSGGFTERLSFNGTALTDALNPTNNQFNSTVNDQGSSTTYGVDVDSYDISSLLSAGDTSATSVYSSGADLVILSTEVISVTNTDVSDLSINMTGPASVASSSNYAFTITVTNNGPIAHPASTITVTDTLPTGFNFVSASGTGWSCGAVGQDVTCTHPGPLSIGSSLADITLNIATGVLGGGTITNTATVSSAQFDHQPGNNSSSVTSSLPAPSCDIFRDEFSVRSYSNNHGDAWVSWASDWIETGDGGGSPTNGDIIITNAGQELRLQDDNNAIRRMADLSAYDSASLSFDYHEVGLENSNEWAAIEIRTGGGGWNRLSTFAGPVNDSGTYTTTIDSYLAADTEIRFVTSTTSSMGNWDDVYFDNVQIEGCKPAAVDHYEISYTTGSIGVTCEAHLVTVTAHDSSHNPVNVSSDTNVTIATSPAVDAITSTPVTIPSGSSAVNFYITETTATTAPHIDINVTDGTSTELSGSATAADDPALEFSDAAFRFVDTATSNAITIGNQIGGKPSSTASGSQTIGLQAIRTDTSTGACQPAFVSQTVSVDLGYECNNPTSCTGINLLNLSPESTYNSGSAVTLSRNDNGAVASYTSVDLVFDANGIAPLSFICNDAGQITLHATKTLTANPAATPPITAATLSGGSNAFVTRPFAFDLDFTNARAADWLDNGALDGSGGDTSFAANAAGSAFIAAGTNFPMALTSVLWQAADDADNDGVPDSGANLTNNGATPNFGQESAGSSVTFGYALDASMAGGSSSGTFTATPVIAGGATNFTAGVATTTMNWDEVGIIDITAALANYLGSGSSIPGTADNVGRFVPASYLVTVANAGSFTNTHTLGATPFTYLGQSFGYMANPSFTITAVNNGGGTVANYTGIFNFLTASEIILGYPASDNAQLGTDANPLAITSTLGTPSLADNGDGTMTLTLGGTTADNFAYNRALGMVTPFNANLTIALTGINETNDTVASNAINVSPAGNLQRYGRAVLSDVYGATDSTLNMPFNTEFYDGAVNLWNTNTDDLSTSIAVATDTTCNSGDFSCSVDGTAANMQVTGVNITPGSSFTLTPTTPITGVATITLTTPNWLTFDWDGDAVPEFSSATATFGIYRGDDRFYYWREER